MRNFAIGSDANGIVAATKLQSCSGKCIVVLFCTFYNLQSAIFTFAINFILSALFAIYNLLSALFTSLVVLLDVVRCRSAGGQGHYIRLCFLIAIEEMMKIEILFKGNGTPMDSGSYDFM